MKEFFFSDIIDLVEAVRKQPYVVEYSENIGDDPPTLGFSSLDGNRFAITLKDFQESIKKKAPNSNDVVLFTAAIKTEEGRKNFYKVFNEGKKDKIETNKYDENKYEKIISEVVKPEGNLVSDGNLKTQIVSIMNDCVKDFLTAISTVSDDVLEEWKDNNVYAKLLIDVLNGNGPKELWLKVVLDHLDEHGGNLEK